MACILVCWVLGGNRRAGSTELTAGLYDCNFLFRQAVEVIDEAVNLAVGGVNLALEPRLIVRRLGRGTSLVQVEHALNQRNHLVVFVLCGRSGKIDRAYGNSGYL